jgi:hypothetical protein
MTKDQFEAAYQGFGRRRPFRAFLMEFNSGRQVIVSHPEAVRSEGDVYVLRRPDGGHVVFAAESVCRLLDVPRTPTA